jgi:hypothetical protein
MGEPPASEVAIPRPCDFKVWPSFDEASMPFVLDLEKTKLVHGKDASRKADHVDIKFHLLGCSFRPRLTK